MNRNAPLEIQKLQASAEIESCIRSLEEERRKIEVFRRELQLCVRLLGDGEN
jgi:hypothetical protein